MQISITPGMILAAHPKHNNSPTFDRTVLVITEHTVTGTMAVIINRSYPLTQNQMLAQKGLASDHMDDRPIYTGGPVNPTALIMLHTDEWFSSNTKRISPGLSMSSDEFMLEKLATGNHPQRWKWIAGMATWRPQQLSEEIEGTGLWQDRAQWLPLPYEESLLWKTQGQSLWRRAIDMHAKHTIASFF